MPSRMVQINGVMSWDDDYAPPGSPPGYPAHPIYWPPIPTHPIAPGGGLPPWWPGRPEHPIPPGIWPQPPIWGGSPPTIWPGPGQPPTIWPGPGLPPTIWPPPGPILPPGGTTPPPGGGTTPPTVPVHPIIGPAGMYMLFWSPETGWVLIPTGGQPSSTAPAAEPAKK